MKKILIVVAFLIGVLFLACGKVSEPKNISLEKNLKEYVLSLNRELIIVDTIPNKRLTKKIVSTLTFTTDEEAYLDIYERFCKLELFNYCEKESGNNYEEYSNLKLLDENGVNILHIKFPYQEEKENAVWMQVKESWTYPAICDTEKVKRVDLGLFK